ncbi:MAG: hypothetical protein QOD38_508 [Acidimicrobiaceae bacterium]
MDDLERELRRTFEERASRMPDNAPLPESLRRDVLRARRRKATAIGGAAVLSVAAIVAGLVLRANGTTERVDTIAPATTTLPPTTSTTIASGPPQCTAVTVTFEGSQGATGSEIGSFWVRNPGSSPCVLHGDIVVDLLDDNGQVVKTVTPPQAAGVSIVLEPHPEEPTNPPPSGLASFDLRWHELDLANGGAPCSQTVTPTTVRATFDHGAAQATTGSTPRDGSFSIKACNGEIDMSPLRPLT